MLGTYVYLYIIYIDRRMHAGILNCQSTLLFHSAQVLAQDMKKLCYHFTWQIVDSRHFALPQRRNRIWGVAAVITGEEDPKRVGELYSECLDSMKSNFQFPTEVNFPPKPKENYRKRQHKDLVESAKQQSFRLTDVFVDCNGTMRRQVYCFGAVPCVIPKHPVFSVEMGRYLGAEDLLNCQGLWRSTWSPAGFEQLLQDPVLAHDLAGNSFSSTVCQSVLLSTFVCLPAAWSHAGASNPPDADANPGRMLRRLRGKQASDQYGPWHIQRVEKAERFGRSAKAKKARRKVPYARKSKDGDSRRHSKGKKEVASIWKKEQLLGT